MAARKKRTGIEWVGGLVSMPAYVTGEGEPYRPETLFWIGADGIVIGYSVGTSGELVTQAAESLLNTIERPLFGDPHVPDRVRVASAELADALRAPHVGIEIVCAPTPELDAMLAEMHKRVDEHAETAQTYLSPEIGPDAVGAFFRAAANLFRAKPWKVVPSDQSLLSVSIEKLGIRQGIVAVMGQLDQPLGLVLFAGLGDFEAYLEAIDAMEHAEEPALPPHFALNFERGAELATALRKEIVRHRWEVAAASAYPRLVVVDESSAGRSPTAPELTIVETVALALTKLLAQKKALRAAWDGGEPVERTLTVSTHAGQLEVVLRAPYEYASARFRPPYDVIAGLFALGQDGAEMDAEVRVELEDELLRRFLATQLGATLPDLRYCELVMDFAATYFGATIATLRPNQLREIVFEIIPNKVNVGATAASAIIYDNRALYAFLKLDLGLEQADACLRVLSHSSVKKLERALSDASKFSVGKSLLLAGLDAALAMESKAAIAASLQAMQTQPRPRSRRADIRQKHAERTPAQKPPKKKR